MQIDLPRKFHFSCLILLLLSTSAILHAQFVANPTTVAFGNVVVGGSGTILETFQNNGSTKLTISQASISGAGFKKESCKLPVTLIAGQSKTCSLFFYPASSGSVQGALLVYWRTSGGTRQTTTIVLSGTGVSSGQLQGQPTALNFGSQQTGSSTSLAETVTNSGSTAITISQVSVSGTGFAFSGINPPVTLSGGQSAGFSVTFAPQSGGSSSGSLVINSNATNGSLSIALAGSAVAPGQMSVSPASTTFGNVVVGTQQNLQATISAVGGPVTVSSIGLNGSEFSLSGIAVPISLAAGQSAPFTLTFAPQITGAASGAVTFMSSTSPAATESLSGTGVTPPQHSVTLNWSPSSSSNITGYNVYRGSQSGGPFGMLNSGLDAATHYIDSNVTAGQTYFYVVTAVDTSGTQSSYSNQVQANIPTP